MAGDVDRDERAPTAAGAGEQPFDADKERKRLQQEAQKLHERFGDLFRSLQQAAPGRGLEKPPQGRALTGQPSQRLDGPILDHDERLHLALGSLERLEQSVDALRDEFDHAMAELKHISEHLEPRNQRTGGEH